MGLFDNIAGAVMGKVMGEKGNLAQAAMDMLEQHGGISGLVDKFKEGGLAELADSWVGTGENQPISAEQINSVLGDSLIAETAAKFGMESNELSEKVATYLPMLIDKLTPNGEVEEGSGNVMSVLLSLIKK